MAGNKRPRQQNRKGTREKDFVFVQDDKGLPLDREETDPAHRLMAIYKDKRGNPALE